MKRSATIFLVGVVCLPFAALPPGQYACGQDSVSQAPTPEEARQQIRVAEGLELQLFASEPQVAQPVSISFDDRGRMWVLEYIQYPNPNGLKATAVDQYLRTKYDRLPDPPPRGPQGADRITILEDTDGDGRADRTKQFLSGLNLASGMALGYGGVFVAQPPYLLYYADRDRDDVPDGDPEVLLTGFGMEDAHAFANSLTWGPDGWLYGAQGSTVTANIRGIEFQQGIWRYHVRTKRFELFAEGGGNTWGIEFDPQGRLFAGGNTTEPLCHHVQGAYYIKGFGKHGPLHNPFSFGYFNPVKHVGFLGSALTGGAVIYQGGLLPERFDGAVIYPNLRANAMRVSQLKPSGSTFETHFQEDFAVSSDVWFRPVDCLVGPDGALYAADWCDVNISHTSPKDRSQWYPPSRTDGRIWRFVPAGAKPQPMGPLGLEKLASVELVELLDHNNAWYSREARRILGERQDATIVDALKERLAKATSEKSALEALWAVYVSGGFDEELAETLLDHPFAAVREWTIRLLGDERKISPALMPELVALAERETDLHVRSQLACTAKRLPGGQCLEIVEPMLAHDEDAADPHLPLLIWWAVEDNAISDAPRVLSMLAAPAAWSRPLVRSTLVERLARRYAGDRSEAGWAACGQLLWLAPDMAARNALLAAIDLQLAEVGRVEAPGDMTEAIAETLDEKPLDSAVIRVALRMQIAKASKLALERIADRSAADADRAALLQTLAAVPRAAYIEKLLPLVQEGEPPAIEIAALAALQPYDSPEIAQTLVEQYPRMTAEVKARVRTMLASRATWTESLVAAVEQKQIPAADVGLDQVRQMLVHDQPELTPKIEALWGKVAPATSREKQGRILAIQQILAKGKGDAANGQKLVAKHCQTCHPLFGQGNRIGPDLTGVDRKNISVLLPNIVDPSSVIRAEYVAYAAQTADGRAINGLLAASTADTVTLVDAQNIRTTLARGELDAFEPSPLSLMPERLLDPLADQELRDLFAYLQSDQAPGAAPAASSAQPPGTAVLLAQAESRQKKPAAAVTTKSFVYKKTPQTELEMVVHYPADWKATDKRPAIVFFFGGGWTNGRISQFETQAGRLAARGMVAARADYRVKSRHDVSPKECVEDAKSAVRWLRQHAAELGVDPERIAAAGGSAGGHIAACTALAPGLDAADEDAQISSRPNALVLFNPVLRFDGRPQLMDRIGNDAELGKAISPTLHLAKDSPPTLLMFGDADPLMAQAKEFMAASEKLGHRAELYTAPGQPHSFFNRPPWLEKTTARMDEFLTSIRYLQVMRGPKE